MTAALLPVVLLTVLILGANTLFWTVIGIGRRLLPRRRKASVSGDRFENEDVAVLIPAHNEAAVLEESLRAVAALLPLSQIHVISDGSRDHTADIAARFGVHALDLSPNRGKAGALLAGIEHFRLARRFKVVLLLDADTRPASDYLTTGLPLFDDPTVVAVAGRVKCLWDPPPRTRMGRLLVSYRSRLYAVTQLLVKYGQAARWANAVPIVPGFASMYRTDILHLIDIAAPGLVIEDFNMTFEVHAKKLGRIAFHPDTAVAFTQDPDTWHDYIGQIRRWTLGYWQTVRRHGWHIGRFWTALMLQIAELIASSIVLLLMLPSMLLAVYSETLASRYGNPKVAGLEVIGTLAPRYVVFGFLLPDLALTLFAAITLRRPGLLLLAPLFPFMRMVEAYVCLRAIPPSLWHTQSNGRWKSPTRREAAIHYVSGRHRRPLTGTAIEPAPSIPGRHRPPIVTSTERVPGVPPQHRRPPIVTSIERVPKTFGRHRRPLHTPSLERVSE